MSAGKRRKWPAMLLSTLLGLLCAAVLGALFYGTMVYQLLPEQAGELPPPAQDYGTPLPLGQAADAAAQFPGPQLALTTHAAQERRAEDVRMDGVLCRAATTVYAADGAMIEAVSAWPAAYIGRLAAEGWEPKLIAGCQLAQLEAVYCEQGGRGMLAARDGERVYLLIGPADEQRMYALGASCVLE